MTVIGVNVCFFLQQHVIRCLVITSRIKIQHRKMFIQKWHKRNNHSTKSTKRQLGKTMNIVATISMRFKALNRHHILLNWIIRLALYQIVYTRYCHGCKHSNRFKLHIAGAGGIEKHAWWLIFAEYLFTHKKMCYKLGDKNHFGIPQSASNLVIFYYNYYIHAMCFLNCVIFQSADDDACILNKTCHSKKNKKVVWTSDF